MDAPLSVAQICFAAYARLLLESSQERHCGSATFAKRSLNATSASLVAALLIASFLPVSSVSDPPYDQRNGCRKVGGSPKEWPMAWPKKSFDLVLASAPTVASSDHVNGNLSTPACFRTRSRQWIAFPSRPNGTARQTPCTWAFCFIAS